MTGPIVHIGYHKTGTTWFQRHFYPRVAGRRYVDQADVRAALLAPDALSFDPAAARRRLGPDLDRAILCEENLSGALHNGGLAGCLSKDVATRIRATLPDARIVIVVRAQADAIASAYVQYVKGGGTHRVRRYLFGRALLGPNAPEHDEAPRFRFEHFAYDRLIAHYDALFGPERVHVLRYEDFRDDPRGFAAGFAAEHGLDVAVDALDLGRANPGLGRGLLAAMRLANRFTARRGLGGKPAGTRALLGDPLVAWIDRHYRESNDALVRRTGIGWPADRSHAASPAVGPSRWQRILAS